MTDTPCDAIVLSNFAWRTFTVAERVSLALARIGMKVLHCENPRSLLWERWDLAEISERVFNVTPLILGNRFNRFPLLNRWQVRLIAAQLGVLSRRLGLRRPLLIYLDLTKLSLLPLVEEMRPRASRLVCLHLDETDDERCIEAADLALSVISETFLERKRRHGPKLRLMPTISNVEAYRRRPGTEPAELAGVARPRLGYLGPAYDRLDVELVRQVLLRNAGWQMVVFEDRPAALSLPNCHLIPWQDREVLPGFAASFDAGFMPYNCADPKQKFCSPLKLFDYFCLGLPVVSTPISYVRRFPDLVYVGGTPTEIEDAVRAALSEPADSPKRALRKAVAEKHSIERVAPILRDHLFGQAPEDQS